MYVYIYVYTYIYIYIYMYTYISIYIYNDETYKNDVTMTAECVSANY